MPDCAGLWKTFDSARRTYLEQVDGCLFVPKGTSNGGLIAERYRVEGRRLDRPQEGLRVLTRKQHELLVFIDKHLRETGFSPSFEEMKEALNLRSKSGIHRLITALEERGFLRRRAHRARALEVIRLPDNLAPRRAGAWPAPAVASAAAPSPRDGSPRDGSPRDGGARDGGFTPNVIRGNFTAHLAGVQKTAGEAAAVQLPLYGRIAAGLPIEALRDGGTVTEVPASMLAGGEHYALEVAGDSMVDAGILDGDTVVVRRAETAENGTIVVALVDENEVTLKRLRRRGNSIALEAANPRHETRIFGPDRVKVQGVLVGLMRRY
jgi:repressor LexA